MYRHIIVAIDDSDTSRKALEEAILVARVQGASLEIVHATDESQMHVFHAGGMTTMSRDTVMHTASGHANACLEQAQARASEAGIQARTRLLHGNGQQPADLIADAVRTSDADLLVVGSHGRRGVRRLLLGSVAADLVRKVSISTLIVRGMEQPQDEKS